MKLQLAVDPTISTRSGQFMARVENGVLFVPSALMRALQRSGRMEMTAERLCERLDVAPEAFLTELHGWDLSQLRNAQKALLAIITKAGHAEEIGATSQDRRDGAIVVPTNHASYVKPPLLLVERPGYRMRPGRFMSRIDERELLIPTKLIEAAHLLLITDHRGLCDAFRNAPHRLAKILDWSVEEVTTAGKPLLAFLEQHGYLPREPPPRTEM